MAKFIADLHIHSKYSRATSPKMNLEDLDCFADDKGILVMATGDFTHHAWMKEIKTKLEPAEPGLYKLKKEFKKPTLKGTFSDTRFILSVEIAGIYSKGGKCRRIHNLVFAPSIETAEKINSQLSKIGNIKSDGRPILGLDSENLAGIIFETSPDAVIIPAHIWTPWFSVFGSMSGFDRLEECFGKYTKNIFAVETGLSSDPAMNWQVSQLDNVALISNSDSHSLEKIGREANIFDTELSYKGIMEAIKSGSPIEREKRKGKKEKFVATIEFFPEEGKYHYDGHSACGVSLHPEETIKLNNICPKCKKSLIIGVMNRVQKLTDRKIELKTKNNFNEYLDNVPFYSLIGLSKIIADAFGVGENTKKVKTEYEKLIKLFGSELEILIDPSKIGLENIVNIKVAEGIRRVQEKNLTIKPGYDGEYGKIKIFENAKKDKTKK